MAHTISLDQWSHGLLHEVFDDVDGSGRPITNIFVENSLFQNAASRIGIEENEEGARHHFLRAFPPRDRIASWARGASPRSALPAFLILCCLVASEAAGSDLNNYRTRFRELMDWDDEISDFGGLPGHWETLRRRLEAMSGEVPMRGLILPDPGYRTQIGHAVELTFPSRVDGRKLSTELRASRPSDVMSPGRVIEWLDSVIARRSFSTTFREAFRDFRALWSAGRRAVTDHRFWVAWLHLNSRETPVTAESEFLITTDEWGGYRVAWRSADSPMNLGEPRQVARLDTAAKSLVHRHQPLFFTQADWGEWRWNPGRDTRFTNIVLFHVAATPLSTREAVKSHRVEGAEDWLVTHNVQPFLRAVRNAPESTEFPLDFSVSGSPRHGAMILCRPSFPLTIRATGPAALFRARNPHQKAFKIAKVDRAEWRASARASLDEVVVFELESSEDNDVITRSVRFCSSDQFPRLQPPNFDRYQLEERPTPADWSYAEVEASHSDGDVSIVADSVPSREEVRDLIEYFAMRSGPLPLGGVIEMLREILPDEVSGWDVLRSFNEAGILEPLRVRGWRGKSVLAKPPAGVLSWRGRICVLVLDGIVNEALAARFEGMAREAGVLTHVNSGVSEWAPPTHLALAGKSDALQELADRLEIPFSWLKTDLRSMRPLADREPIEDGTRHTERVSFRINSDPPVSVLRCQRPAQDGSTLWASHNGGGALRFWSDRNLAILDALRLHGVVGFTPGDDRMIAEGAGRLPLAVARWLRCFTGRSAGPSGDDYVYGYTPAVIGSLEWILASLLPTDPSLQADPRPLVFDRNTRWMARFENGRPHLASVRRTAHLRMGTRTSSGR